MSRTNSNMYDFCTLIQLIVNDVYPCDYSGGRSSKMLEAKKVLHRPLLLERTFTFPVSNSLSRPIDSEAWCEAAASIATEGAFIRCLWSGQNR
jgi:hypothetical protein